MAQKAINNRGGQNDGRHTQHSLNINSSTTVSTWSMIQQGMKLLFKRKVHFLSTTLSRFAYEIERVRPFAVCQKNSSGRTEGRCIQQNQHINDWSTIRQEMELFRRKVRGAFAEMKSSKSSAHLLLRGSLLCSSRARCHYYAGSTIDVDHLCSSTSTTCTCPSRECWSPCNWSQHLFERSCV